MRHRLIHGYAEIDLGLVWLVLTEKLGPLTATLARLVPPEGAPDV